MIEGEWYVWPTLVPKEDPDAVWVLARLPKRKDWDGENRRHYVYMADYHGYRLTQGKNPFVVWSDDGDYTYECPDVLAWMPVTQPSPPSWFNEEDEDD